MGETLSIGAARSEEMAEAFQLIFQHIQDQDGDYRVVNAVQMLQQGELEPAGILVARIGSSLVGAMICLPVPGASALIWPPQAVPGERQSEIEDRLLESARAFLQQRGAKLAQTLLSPLDSPLGASLLRNGFAHVTNLTYMRHGLVWPAEWSRLPMRLTYQPYSEPNRAAFELTLSRTYEGTRDCPEVNGVRDLDEVLEGHRAQGKHDPALWWLAFDGSRPVGVVLLTEVPEWQAWDLSYIGVVAESRRFGFGKEMTRRALLAAREAGQTLVTLAVDSRNVPAHNLYLSLGFRNFDEREVYLAIWGRARDR